MASTNIFSQYLQAPRSVLDYQAQYEEGDARKANLQARTQQNALQALALRQQTDQFGQAQTERNALQRIAAGWSAATPVDQRIASLRNSGMPGLMSQADALEASDIKRRDGESQISERESKVSTAKTENLVKQLGVLKSLAGQVFAMPDPQTAMAAIDAYERQTGQSAQEQRDIVSRLQTPDQIKRWAAGLSMQADKLLPTLQTRNTGGTTDTLAIDPVSGVGAVTGSVKNTATPGELIASSDRAKALAAENSRAAASRAQSAEQFNKGQAAGKAPSGYRANPDGTLSFIPGGPADPANKSLGEPTEGERKAATLLTRLRGSQSQLTQALTDSPGAAKPGVIASSVRRVAGDDAANVITGQERQRVEAAQLDLLDAALTLGTGAAYTTEQLKGYSRSYFPQIGDDSKTIADKKERLKTVIKAAEVAAGRAEKLTPKPASPNPKPKPGKGTDLGDGFTVVN